MVLLFVALAEVSRRPRGELVEARGGSRSLGGLAESSFFVILPSKFHFAEQFAQQIARQIVRQIAQIDGFAQQMENLPSKVTK